MFRSIIAIAATIAILGGCASANEMLELEPRAKFQAKNELPQFRDCLFRWSSSRLYTLEYNPEGIFVKSVGGPMYLISQRSGVVSVYVHWNMMGGWDLPVYIAGRCNDDPTSTPPAKFWMTMNPLNLPEADKYISDR